MRPVLPRRCAVRRSLIPLIMLALAVPTDSSSKVSEGTVVRDVRDARGREQRLEVFRHDLANTTYAAKAISAFCHEHNFDPVAACIEGIFASMESEIGTSQKKLWSRSDPVSTDTRPDEEDAYPRPPSSALRHAGLTLPHPCVHPDGRAIDSGCEPWFDPSRAYDAPVHPNAAKYLMHERSDRNITIFFPQEGQVIRSDSVIVIHVANWMCDRFRPKPCIRLEVTTTRDWIENDSPMTQLSGCLSDWNEDPVLIGTPAHRLLCYTYIHNSFPSELNLDVNLTVLLNSRREATVSFTTVTPAAYEDKEEDSVSTKADCSFGPMEAMIGMLDYRLFEDPGAAQLLGCARSCRMNDLCFDSVKQRLVHLSGWRNLEGDDVLSLPYPQTQFCNHVDTIFEEPFHTTFESLKRKSDIHWLEMPVVVYSPRPVTDLTVATSPLHLWVDELSALWRAVDVARTVLGNKEVHILVTGLSETQLGAKLGQQALPLSFITGNPRNVHFAAEHGVTCFRDSFININPFRLFHLAMTKHGGLRSGLHMRSTTLWSVNTYTRFYDCVRSAIGIQLRTKSDVFTISVTVRRQVVNGKMRQPTLRVVVNLAEILAEYCNRHPSESIQVEPVDFAAIGSFADQQRSLQQTHVLLGIYGSAFVHALFMNAGTACIQIKPMWIEYIHPWAPLNQAALMREIVCPEIEPLPLTARNKMYFNNHAPLLLADLAQEFQLHGPLKCDYEAVAGTLSEVKSVLT